MTYIVEGKYADWELVDDGIADLQSAIDWAKDVNAQDEVKVRVIDDITKKVVWVR
jgi:uncharacterized Zn finger protein